MGFKMSKLWHDITAHAKVNLCLQVLGKREDGYHDLLSFVGFTDFGDQLSVCVHREDKFSITGPFAKTLEAAGGDSLCSKAVTLIREAGFNLPPLYIRLEKNIPLGGGLGGGSSDAAALLRLIARDLLPKQIKNEQLYKLAEEIGADVPVCLMPDWQIMTGTGTQTQPASLPRPRPRSIDAPIYAVLANPQIHLSTAEIFVQIDFYSAANLSQLEGFIASGALADIVAIGNDMATPVCAKYPEIAALIDHLNMPHDGFIGAGMSGSGASCFALTKNKEAAEKCCASLSEKNIWAQVTRMRD